MSSWTKIVLILAATASGLAGCGVRGALERPSASINGEGAPSNTASADSGQGKKIDDAPKPHKSFFLDGLLQ